MFTIARTLIVPTLITSMVMLCSCSNLMRHENIRKIQKDKDKGKCEKVLTEADAAAGLSSDTLYQAELAFLKAECLEQLDRKEEAQQLYHYLINECSSSPYSYQANTRLKILTESKTAQ